MKNKYLPFVSSFAFLLASQALAQDATPPPPQVDTGDTAWIMVATALVMLMTPGLAFFYAGMTRTKNVVSTLLQNYSALAVVGVLWAVVGYTLAFGSNGNGFIGGLNYFFLNGVGQEPNADYAATIPHVLFMLFQCMFAVITPVLITGAIAERVKFKGLLAFIAAWSLLVYVPVAHWVWGVGGFIRNMGGLDFAGGMVVHMTAGFSAIAAVLLLGRRRDFEKVQARPYDVGMILLGTTLLWFGWFGFNAGSALGANGLAAHAFSTTFFASATAMLTWMIVDMFRKGKPSAVGAGIGAVAGLVTVTPAAGFVTFGSALLIGFLAGFVCNYAVSFIKEKLHLDDTLDVIGCHGVGGFLGTVLTALFATKAVNSAGADGVFFGGGLDLLRANLLGSLAVIAISFVGTFIAYKVADILFGMRVSDQEEAIGLDASQHDEVINENFHSQPTPEVAANKPHRVA